MIRSVRRGFFINDHDFNWRVKNLLFILWPFGTFIYSLRCLQSKSSRWIFFLTCMAFGLCIECKNDTFDMSRITDIFYSYQNMDFRGLKNIFVDFYNGYGERDLYESVLSWSVNQISSNHHLFWMVASMVYAFFYIKSLCFILDDKRFYSCLTGLIVVAMFTLPETIFTVTGLRFWTAGWLAILCTLNIIINRDYKYYIIILLTPFIHVTYWIYVFLLFIFEIVKKYNARVFVLIYLFSFLFSELSIEFVYNLIDLDILPRNLSLVAASYTDANHIDDFNRVGTGWSWLSDLFDFVLKLYYTFLLLFIYYKGKIDNKTDGYLLCFLFIIDSFANFTIFVPHLGLRYMGFVRILIPVVWFRVFGLHKYKFILTLYPFFASFYIIYTLLLHRFAYVLNIDFLYDSFFLMIVKNLICA